MYPFLAIAQARTPLGDLELGDFPWYQPGTVGTSVWFTLDTLQKSRPGRVCLLSTLYESRGLRWHSSELSTAVLYVMTYYYTDTLSSDAIVLQAEPYGERNEKFVPEERALKQRGGCGASKPQRMCRSTTLQHISHLVPGHS